jgi:hypothetical protein
LAESAKAAAETAQGIAATAKTDALLAKSASETAKDNAVAAQTASESAKTNAQDWASKTTGAVVAGEYSAKYHATAASGSATTAAATVSDRYTKAETDAKIVALSPPATKAHVESLGIAASSITGALPAISGANLTGIETVTKASSNPLLTTNGSIGDQWINTTTGELFILKDATTDDNIWKGQDGSEVNSSTVSTFDLFADSSAKALYEMNGNSNDTGGNYNASDTGNITYTTGGPTGIYANFQPGKTDEINIPLGSWMSNRTDFTVSLWTATAPNGAWNYQFMLGNTSHSAPHYRLGVHNSTIVGASEPTRRFIYGDNSNVINLPDDTTGKWEHMVFSVTSNVCTCYASGVSVGTLSGNVGTCHAYIGINAIPALGAHGSGSAHDADQSNVTQVRIFNRGVTAAEVAILYAEGS